MLPGTACWPCRQRKVKCDNKQPCENCVKRDHANLCSYNPKQNAAKGSSGSVVGIKRGRSPGSEDSLRKEEDRWPRTTGKSYFSCNLITVDLSYVKWFGGASGGSLEYPTTPPLSCASKCFPMFSVTL